MLPGPGRREAAGAGRLWRRPGRDGAVGPGQQLRGRRPLPPRRVPVAPGYRRLEPHPKAGPPALGPRHRAGRCAEWRVAGGHR